MSWLEDLPIRRRLTFVILLTCGIVLLSASTALAVYEWFDFRRALARDTTVLSDIIGSNSGAVLSFDDDKAAQEILAAVASEPHIVAARLYRQNGTRFVDYLRPRAGRELPMFPGADGARFEQGYLTVFRPVMLNEKRIGTIYLLADLEGVRNRLWLFGSFAAIVIIGSFWLAFALSTELQRPITEPILKLADTAQVIANRKDYSVRANAEGHGEVGLLTRAFNDMLSGIEARDSALRTTNEKLSDENAERLLAEDRARSQIARLGQINQITRAIGQRQDVESIFQAVVGNLEEHMPVDFACVCLYDAVRDLLTVTSVGPRSVMLASHLLMPEKAEIVIEVDGLSRCVRGELVYEADIAEAQSAFTRRLAEGGLRSMVLAPLLVESKVFGVLVAGRCAPRSFSSSDCEFLGQLSEHVALAAHQTQLYLALQRAYDDLRQTQQVVMQQERLRALGQMASGIAHDINNAVSPVSLYVESILEKEPHLTAQSRDWLQTVQRAIEDVANTVARMREFYRQREPQLSLVPVALNSIVEQVADLTRARWFDMPQQRGLVIDLRKELAADLPPVLGVESEIREALINLVFNGVDALTRGGVLTLRTRRLARSRVDGDGAMRVALEVTDTGMGMDEETQRRCLEPFFTTKGERGTGLGLAMVYGIVKRHNAEIEITSTVGRGTTMRIIFAVATNDTPAVPAESPAGPAPRMRLLVVDDDPLLLKSLREILEGDGHVVTTASGGQAGINAFEDAHDSAEPFAAVITDLGMPYVDGGKVATAVKSLSPRTPVFLLTGWGTRLRGDDEVPSGVDLVLRKPPRLRELREALLTVPILQN
jgi:signal transduction histidine kinase/CheY-like chemotaxis protein/HAMP domain-containing protein